MVILKVQQQQEHQQLVQFINHFVGLKVRRNEIKVISLKQIFNMILVIHDDKTPIQRGARYISSQYLAER
jgi:hypothetical protein